MTIAKNIFRGSPDMATAMGMTLQQWREEEAQLRRKGDHELADLVLEAYLSKIQTYWWPLRWYYTLQEWYYARKRARQH